MAEESETQTSTSTSESSSHKSSEDTLKQPQVPGLSGFAASPNGDIQMFPIIYPALVPGLFPLQNQEQMNRGAGIYAVPVLPFMGPVAGLPSNTLIPLTYNLPTRPTSSEAGAVGEEQGQVGQQQQQQQPAPQRQVVVRRFQIAIQLDLLLILKLAAVIFLFNQDGSRQRLVLLVFFASLVYLYQTGALAPLIRWLSQGMQRAAAPPQPPRPAVRAENVPAAARQGNENAPVAEGQPGAENENQPANDGNRVIEDEHVAEPAAGNGGNRWWGILKEIQMIVFGFITSLLPGFHNID
uniref:Transmembrane protein n=1 Tax=Davidia involucrata TaxID=16924 RepID=A0A5B6YV86_DAVIN